MKTIRQSVYETNSSASHAFTLSLASTARVDLNIIPDDNGEIHVILREADEPMPQNKIGHTLYYAYLMGDQELFDRTITLVEKHTGGKVVTQLTEWDGSKRVTTSPMTVRVKEVEDEDDECFGEREEDEEMRDAFCTFINDGGYYGVSEFVNAMEKYTATDDALMKFLFSSTSTFNIYSYYN